MSRVISILIVMLAAATAAAGVQLPPGAEQLGVLDNAVAYFQRVSSAAGTGTSTQLQRTLVRRYTGAGHVIDNDSVQMTRFPGGYLSRGGSAYYYLTDYQGNNIAVVDAAGSIIQHTDYYPYGEPWRYPDGQPYLFSDKELTRADGRHAYTFPARTLLPNLPRWSTPDPLAEQTPWDSPYAYCAANPIANIDPTGLKFTPESEPLLNIYQSHLNDAYQLCVSKLLTLPTYKTSTLNVLVRNERYDYWSSRLCSIVETYFELYKLKQSTTLYHIKNLNLHEETKIYKNQTSWNNDLPGVEIQLVNLNDMHFFFHEMKHAYQFEIGEISFGIEGKSDSNGLMDFYDEVDAYNRGSLFGSTIKAETHANQSLNKTTRVSSTTFFSSFPNDSEIQKYSDDHLLYFKAKDNLYTPTTIPSE